MSADRRLERTNAIAATAFVIGGSLFCLGALLAQADVGGPRLAAAVFVVGGVFFTTGGYSSVLLVANADGESGAGGRPNRGTSNGEARSLSSSAPSTSAPACWRH